jgi:hypothetical protein
MIYQQIAIDLTSFEPKKDDKKGKSLLTEL